MSDSERRSLLRERGGINTRTVLGYIGPVIGALPTLLSYDWIAIDAQPLAQQNVSLALTNSLWGYGIIVGVTVALAGALVRYRTLQLVGGLIMGLMAIYTVYTAWTGLNQIQEMARTQGFTGSISITVGPSIIALAIGTFSVILAALLPEQGRSDSRFANESGAGSDNL